MCHNATSAGAAKTPGDDERPLARAVVDDKAASVAAKTHADAVDRGPRHLMMGTRWWTAESCEAPALEPARDLESRPIGDRKGRSSSSDCPPRALATLVFPGRRHDHRLPRPSSPQLLYATKTISTGEGGMLVSRRPEVLEHARAFRKCGKPDQYCSSNSGRMRSRLVSAPRRPIASRSEAIATSPSSM
jgi:DegT/DnrJ/EryC1/StrS aminotransferase family